MTASVVQRTAGHAGVQTCRFYLTAAAGRGGAEEEAERSAWRPIADGAEFHGFPCVFFVCDLIGELGGKDDDALLVADQYVTRADQVSSA